MSDLVERLIPCGLCGGVNGYRLSEGSTHRWWNVQCCDCERIVDECRSDRRTQLGAALPQRWPAADAAWNEAGAYAERLRAEVEALRKDAERYRWLQNACSGEPRVGTVAPSILLFGLQGAAEEAWNDAAVATNHLTDTIDAAMSKI